MSKFNLLDEAWINVIIDDRGNTKEVSIKELFLNAHHFKELAGDMETQNFAVLRFLLAILHTVFSRFDASGKPYFFIELDGKFKPLNDIDEKHQNEYKKQLLESWNNLREQQAFPTIIHDYLSKWHDRFYLLDETYPFYQVTKSDISPEKISLKKATTTHARTINRQISESKNKVALFSPKSESYKDLLKPSELTRWLLTFQGYSSLADKTIFGKEKYKSSKGWLFDIGGIYVKGNNLFETLLLNLKLVDLHAEFQHTQKPCWEYSSPEVIARLVSREPIDNLSELYTNWSRAIYLNPDTNLTKAIKIQIVKLPEIEHKNNFLEPMTLWRYNDLGEYKGSHTPRKIPLSQSAWQAFDLISISDKVSETDKSRQPGIITWLGEVNQSARYSELTIQLISMQDDGNATSWLPIDEIKDSFRINNHILTDNTEYGWVEAINETVEFTRNIVGKLYKHFISDIHEIRNISSKIMIKDKTESLYFSIGEAFQDWLLDISPDDDKDERVAAWKNTLKKHVLDEAAIVLSGAGPRDFVGIIKDGQTKNLATSYNKFSNLLHKV